MKQHYKDCAKAYYNRHCRDFYCKFFEMFFDENDCCTDCTQYYNPDLED